MFAKALNAVGGLFGLGGGQGDYYQAPKLESEAKNRLDEALKMGDNAQVQKLVQQIGGGELSLAQILQGASATGNQDAALQNLVSSPIAGSSIASQQVMEDPLLAGLYGDNSSMSRAVGEEKRLMEQGYKLQPEDYEAYGQASGNVARTFGKQEQGLAQALASRGLSAGSSGAATSGFSNMYGNKLEQLGQMQRQIADDRMNNTRARVADARNFQVQLGSLGQDAQGQKFNQNQQSTQDQKAIYNSDIAAYNAQQNAAQASQKSKEDNRQLGLADAVGAGIMSGTQSMFQNAISGANTSQAMSAMSGMPSGGGTARAAPAPTTTPNRRNYVETNGYQGANR